MTEPDEQEVTLNSEGPDSAERTSVETNEKGTDAEAKIRALEADYKTRIDEVADLITRVRHEINNPLTGVLGQAQLLLREDLNERARKRAKTIEELPIRLPDIG